MSQFPILLAGITIDADNDVLQLDEAGSVQPATLAHGTYWLRGDGGAGDFCPVLVTALNAAFADGNTYAVTLSGWSIDAADQSLTVTVSRATGTATFRVRWNHGSANFPPALLGFTTEKGAADADAEVSTLSPSAVWVSNERFIDWTPRMTASNAEVEGADGSVDVVELSGTVYRGRLSLELVDGRRLWAHENQADPAATLERFWALVRDGRQVEIHTTVISTHPSLTAPALGTSEVGRDVGTYYRWLLVNPSAASLEAERALTGMSHWDLDLHFAGYVA